ncbi:M24 family metallopeptidase [Sedimenticola selenatireducens]|uniref:Aminopeptidase P family protein n=1 Tax=Sedimenticola selenatireducens TaxID=191960 RepID=A0A2N6CWF8_9GAMM|nr:Xaa-Pro peptidase family protein [Sedimenticola selenatireducens]PLX61590.1 MAG: aminopeptidase P family protein [Sedimenticola selenatireducens]
MHYNRPHATATWGTMGKDWEAGVDFAKLNRERKERAQVAIKNAGLGAVLCFTFDNIRYVTGTHIGEWARDKSDRYVLCPAEGCGEPFLWDPAPPAKRKSSPWLTDRIGAPISTLQGAVQAGYGVEKVFARQIKESLVEMGLEDKPVGIDLMELSMLRALEAEGIIVVDGQQAMLDAREIKTAEESELLKQAAAMVDATYMDIAQAIRPGTKESDLVAIAHEKLFKLGSERVECVNYVAGPRGAPHSHTFSDRIIQPGDMIFLDIMPSYNGYRTCYYRTFICGQPNQAQKDAYEKCSEWVNAALDAIKPGVTIDEVAAVWPKAEEFGYKNEDEAFLLQFGHGIGLSLWERPIISRRYMGQETVLKEGMVFAVECWKGADDGSGAARIEEEVVVTKDGCQIITNFPSDHLISCGLPGCEIY